MLFRLCLLDSSVQGKSYRQCLTHNLSLFERSGSLHMGNVIDDLCIDILSCYM